jgi:hypothetical protein
MHRLPSTAVGLGKLDGMLLLLCIMHSVNAMLLFCMQLAQLSS